MRQDKHVCVIGAGSSGLVAIKELLDEGHRVKCFEKFDSPGGAFYRAEGLAKSGAYDSTMLTISNYMMAFSSFPPPLSEQRKFWTAEEYQAYLLAFTKHFSLEQWIAYRTEVVSVEKCEQGGYQVQVACAETGTLQPPMHFDAVAICTGSSRIPRYIELKGQEDFQGDVYHSAFYRNAAPYKGRRALCIGMGETGVDVVNELAGVAEKCILSLRQRQPAVERFPLFRSHPSDAYTAQFLHAMPVKAGNARMRWQFLAMRRFGKEERTRLFADWNLKAGDYYNHFNIKSDVFIDRLVDKQMTVNTSGIDHLGPDYVVFKDGQREQIDMIMLNTGYMDQFSFLKGVDVPDVRKLYKHMIHPDLGAGVVFIGWARPAVGGVPACSEMQSRYFALLCSGKKTLPEPHRLRRLIARHKKYEDHVYHKNPRVRSLVHYSGYMNDFAKVIGCSPWRYSTFLNPKMAYRLWVGSQMPTIYRLYGPHRDYEKAKQSICNVPIAFNFAEAALLTAFTGVTRALAGLKIVPPDPKY